ADPLVAEPRVDTLRGRVRRVGVEEAEAAGVELVARDLGRERGRVAAAARLRPGVDRPDPDAARRRAAVAAHRDRLAAVLPEHDAAVHRAETLLDLAACE